MLSAIDAWELREMALKAALEENATLYRRLEALERLVAIQRSHLDEACLNSPGVTNAEAAVSVLAAGEEKP